MNECCRLYSVLHLRAVDNSHAIAVDHGRAWRLHLYDGSALMSTPRLVFAQLASMVPVWDRLLRSDLLDLLREFLRVRVWSGGLRPIAAFARETSAMLSQRRGTRPSQF